MINFNRLFRTAGATMLTASSVVGLSPGTAAAASTCRIGVEPPIYNGSIVEIRHGGTKVQSARTVLPCG